MIKYLAIAFILGQALAAPGGMGGFGLNPWASYFMPSWVNPQPAASAADGDAAAPAPAPVFPPFAMQSPGFAFAILGFKNKIAQNECQTKIDKIKFQCAGSTDPCCKNATDQCTLLENDLKSSFEPCKMKQDVMEMCFAAKMAKRQAKMAKMSCKLDPTTCETAPASDPTAVAPAFDDISTKSDKCANDVKTDQLDMIQYVDDQLKQCQMKAEAPGVDE